MHTSAKLPPPWSPVNWWKFGIIVFLIFTCGLIISNYNLARSANVAAFGLVWFLLIWAAQQRPRLIARHADGAGILEWRLRYRFGFPSALAAPVIVLMVLAGRPRNLEQVVAYVALLGLLGFGWILQQQVARERFLVTEDGIERRSPWTGKRSKIAWSSVTSVRWDAYYGRFVLVCTTERRLAINHRIDGIGEFAATALRRVPESAFREAVDVRSMLEQIASRLPHPQ